MSSSSLVTYALIDPFSVLIDESTHDPRPTPFGLTPQAHRQSDQFMTVLQCLPLGSLLISSRADLSDLKPENFRVLPHPVDIFIHRSRARTIRKSDCGSRFDDEDLGMQPSLSHKDNRDVALGCRGSVLLTSACLFQDMDRGERMAVFFGQHTTRR
ncbi:hypothetical protein BDR06DRAFT_1024927 [Suillus hirtellus]|nr:hypothetical protein BDR06DRAFT_1024927 [Suillus hirtellus]